MIRSLNRMQPMALLLLRLVLGMSMFLHGWEKISPAGGLHRNHLLAGVEAFTRFVATLGLPYWLGYLSVAAEFLGGIMLILGFLTRFCAGAIFLNMLVALWKVNLHHGYGGSEYTLTLISMALMLVTAGSGALSVDRQLGIS